MAPSPSQNHISTHQIPLPSPTRATNALQILADVDYERNYELNKFNDDDTDSTDNESDSPCSIFDVFYESGGSKAILDLTNFDAAQFQTVWNSLSDAINEVYNVGPGRKSQHTGKDILLMMLTVLKHGGSWDMLAKVFNLKGPSFDRMMTKFMDMLSKPLHEVLVVQNATIFSYNTLIKDGTRFRHFPVARYVTDVTFQQANRPSGNMQEGKAYYSGKHKLYGFKVEVSVLPNELALNCSLHYPGSVSYLEIFQRNLDFHKEALRKSRNDSYIPDIGVPCDKFPDEWEMLMEKGYQGAGETIWAITPKKKSKNGVLSREE